VTVVNAATKERLYGIPISMDGMLLTTALDGTANFDLAVCRTYVIRISIVGWRPYSRSIHLTEDKPYALTVELEPAKF